MFFIHFVVAFFVGFYIVANNLFTPFTVAILIYAIISGFVDIIVTMSHEHEREEISERWKKYYDS